MSCNCNKRHPNNWNIKNCDTRPIEPREICDDDCDCHHHHHHGCGCGCGGCGGCKPIDRCTCTSEPVSQSRIGDEENCCDFNGGCGIFKTCCRNRFWPEFSHPRFLCCKDLYVNCDRDDDCGRDRDDDCGCDHKPSCGCGCD